MGDHSIVLVEYQKPLLLSTVPCREAEMGRSGWLVVKDLNYAHNPSMNLDINTPVVLTVAMLLFRVELCPFGKWNAITIRLLCVAVKTQRITVYQYLMGARLLQIEGSKCIQYPSTTLNAKSHKKSMHTKLLVEGPMFA
jgi:hypothetical protein